MLPTVTDYRPSRGHRQTFLSVREININACRRTVAHAGNPRVQVQRTLFCAIGTKAVLSNHCWYFLTRFGYVI